MAILCYPVIRKGDTGLPSGIFERTEEHRENIRRSLTGRKRTPEQRRRISEAKKGKKIIRTPEQRAAFVEALKAGVPRGKDHHFFGRVVTEEEKSKASALHKGMSFKVCRANNIDPEEYKAQIAAGKFWCGMHKAFMPLSEMAGRGVKVGRCITCSQEANRKDRLARVFGVDAAWYETKLAEQGGVCAICKEANTGSSQNKFFAIDHDHATGANRGLLCFPCNGFVGKLESDKYGPAMLYLAQYNALSSKP